jgi:choice-of-anchor B domain-containing protein
MESWASVTFLKSFHNSVKLAKTIIMKYLIFISTFFLGAISIAQTPCVDGMAGEYPCENIDLLSFMPIDEIGGSETNDIWGWVDPVSGIEYAILGRKSGTSFIDISDPINPIYIGNLPASGANSTWRDIKVHDNFAYVVSEAFNHGMQVFDLMKLGLVDFPPVTFEEDAHYEGFSKAHNLVINEESARLYAVGTNTYSGGLHILDVSDPGHPVFIGYYDEDGDTHDAQVVNYSGPDTDYSGHEIAFACNENSVTIIDVTDASSCSALSVSTYEDVQYTHQGWLTEDQRFFLVGDELDEYYDGVNTTTFIWDVQDLDNPFLLGTFVSTTTSIDHNLYIKDNLCYQSNYRAGLRITSLDEVADGVLTEVGYFDLYPSSDSPQFNGTWSNYPFFPSGVVAVTHIEEGVFFLMPNVEPELGCPADYNSDGEVSVADLLILISEFGCFSGCTTDLTGDGSVSVDDLMMFLIAFVTGC